MNIFGARSECLCSCLIILVIAFKIVNRLQKTVDIKEAQLNLKELLSLVGEGTEVVITEGNIPLARLIGFASSAAGNTIAPVNTKRQAGLHSGKIWASGDFDEPLPEEFWTGSV